MKSQQELFEEAEVLSLKLKNLRNIIQNDFEYNLPSKKDVLEFMELYSLLASDIYNWKCNVLDLLKKEILEYKKEAS